MCLSVVRRWRAGRAPWARGWILAAGWGAAALSLPILGFGLFIVVQVFADRAFHPGDVEFFVVILTLLGSLLLPSAAVVLLRTTLGAAPPSTRRPAFPAMTVLACGALAALLVTLVGSLVVASYRSQR